MTDNPGVRFPPPLIFLVFFFAGIFIPWGFSGSPPFGIALIALSLLIFVWGVTTMARARTEIMPHRPASALVTNGPFRLSRNPLYVSMAIGYLGAAVWTGRLGAIALLPVAIAVLRKVVIAREEAYLRRRFGDEYAQYQKRVRRWL